MSRHLSFQERWHAIRAGVTGQWEGFQRDRRRARPTRRLVAQDTDLDYGDREGLLSESRALTQVFGICKRVLRQYAKYCVGTCRLQWLTSDDEWNDLVEARWREFARMPDIYGRHDFRTLAKLVVISELRDGDCFVAKVDANGFPRLQGIEGDRIGNYSGGSINIDTDDVIGGIVLRNGFPAAYRVWERNRYGQFTNPEDKPKAQILHYWDPERFDSYRGVPIFHAGGLDHGRDLKEIIAAEKMAVKRNGKLALIWNTAMGGAGFGAGVDAFNGTIETGDGTTVKTHEVLDGVDAFLLPGEGAKAHESNRPSSAWQGFVEFLIQDFSIGADLPKSFVWSMAGLGGPATRMDSKQAERTFSAKMDALEAKFIIPSAMWWVAFEMERGAIPFNPEWMNISIPRPAHPSIDVGRESAANMNEHRRGVISGLEIADERGKDIYEVMRQRAREAKYAVELAEEFGIPVEMIADYSGSDIRRPMDVETPTKQPESDDEDRAI